MYISDMTSLLFNWSRHVYFIIWIQEYETTERKLQIVIRLVTTYNKFINTYTLFLIWFL